ncbi:unnamed protein product [Pleuronectes platessa]|uniref:Uncharacterized protein n=1 Tax=Pleuronectes platessa TaxID=8262 RepID=A0A9N7YGR9_PLEPL|nr:unnamed protein product [Pleuronectes platessa]
MTSTGDDEDDDDDDDEDDASTLPPTGSSISVADRTRLDRLSKRASSRNPVEVVGQRRIKAKLSYLMHTEFQPLMTTSHHRAALSTTDRSSQSLLPQLDTRATSSLTPSGRDAASAPLDAASSVAEHRHRAASITHNCPLKPVHHQTKPPSCVSTRRELSPSVQWTCTIAPSAETEEHTQYHQPCTSS